MLTLLPTSQSNTRNTSIKKESLQTFKICLSTFRRASWYLYCPADYQGRISPCKVSYFFDKGGGGGGP